MDGARFFSHLRQARCKRRFAGSVVDVAATPRAVVPSPYNGLRLLSAVRH